MLFHRRGFCGLARPFVTMVTGNEIYNGEIEMSHVYQEIQIIVLSKK